MDGNELGLLLPVPTAADDKYTRGTVGFVTGSELYPGAALLGIAGAQATSPGFVRYVGPRRVGDLVLVNHPEVVVSEAPAGPAQSWVLGSGTTPATAEQHANLRAVMATASVAVIDAGALDFIGATETSSDASFLLTPHQGELCRLLNRLHSEGADGSEAAISAVIHPELLDDPDEAFKAASSTARLTGHTVLLKGSNTLVVAPNGEHVWVGPNSPWLATAGTGDVLAGILGGIAAQNPQIAANNWLDIARLAIELHSSAADIAGAAGAVTASSVALAVSQAINKRFHR
ncbi:MAG: hypothetical protein RJA35_663 [Actinomycetota bacterium]|jgi:NAD(P)H-hydrate repair Nnr-like enzyme with NAD(P)H-hydrate dehydratase domain